MQNKSSSLIAFLVKAGIIAALYFVIGIFFQPIEFGSLQLRPSEALNVLVFFTPSAAWGLFIGCVVTNLSSPFGLADIIFGSLATLVSGLIGSKIKNKYLVGLPSVIINGFVVSAIIGIMTDTMNLYFLYVLQIAAGQLLSVYIIGMPIMFLFEKNRKLNELIRK